jgi:hypothetical protein
VIIHAIVDAVSGTVAYMLLRDEQQAEDITPSQGVPRLAG